MQGVQTAMSWLVIVTNESASDFEVVGAFENRDEAVEWAAKAFHEEHYANCLLRVKQMRSATDLPNMENVDQHHKW
jgi:hypothetical protein